MVILVDNVDNFVYNLIISGFADFCHVENFLESFSLIHHGSTGFVHFAKLTFWNRYYPHSHASERFNFPCVLSAHSLDIWLIFC